MIKHLQFDVESSEVIEEDPNSQFATAKIQAFSSDVNRHELYCSEQTLKDTAPTIYDKPILYNIDRPFADFGTHEEPDKTLIAGFVVPDSAEFVRLPDNRLSLVVLAKLWKRYIPKVIEYFKRDDGRKKVSVEMDLYGTAPMQNGLTEMVDFAYLGVCLLGDLITEASPGANIQILSFAKENQEVKEAYQLEFGKFDELDLSIPDSVKKNVEKALSLHKKLGRGANSVILSHAHHIQQSTHTTPDRVKNMAKLLTRYAKRDLSDEESNDHISYLCLGGKEGFTWATGLAKSVEDIENRKLSYFGENMEEFAKDKLGTGSALKVDKSKEAVSNKGWGSVDKTGLRNKILEASNYKPLVHDCYMIVESGFEDAPSEKLKYPVMCIEGDTLVYNEGGLSSALGYAKAGGENGVVSKVEKIQSKLGLGADDKDDSKKEDGKEDNKKENMADEQKKDVKDEEEKKPKEGSKEEEKQETPEEERKEQEKDQKAKDDKKDDKEEKGKKESMSLDAYLDTSAMLAFLEQETEDYADLVDDKDDGEDFAEMCKMAADEAKKGKEQADFSKVSAGLYAKMCKMARFCNRMAADKKEAEKKFAEKEEMCNQFAKENEQLKQFKAQVEQDKFNYEVATTMSEVKEDMPKEEFEALQEKAKEFSLENIDAFKNLARARAFEFSKGKKKDNDGVARFALPWQGTDKDKKSGSPWDRLGV